MSDTTGREVVEFEYQEIDVTEAKHLLPRYFSKYQGLFDGIVNRIESLPQGKAFLIAPKQEIEASALRRLVASMNGKFKNNQVRWRVRLSNQKGAIVCLPVEDRIKRAKVALKPQANGNGTPPPDLQKLFVTAEQVFNTTMTDARNGNDRTVIKAVCFVGLRVLHIRMSALAKALNYSDSTPSVFATEATKSEEVKAKANELIKALNL